MLIEFKSGRELTGIKMLGIDLGDVSVFVLEAPVPFVGNRNLPAVLVRDRRSAYFIVDVDLVAFRRVNQAFVAFLKYVIFAVIKGAGLFRGFHSLVVAAFGNLCY